MMFRHVGWLCQREASNVKTWGCCLHWFAGKHPTYVYHTGRHRNRRRQVGRTYTTHSPHTTHAQVPELGWVQATGRLQAALHGSSTALRTGNTGTSSIVTTIAVFVVVVAFRVI